MKNSVMINLSQETVEALNKGNYTLCCFLACKTGNASLYTPLCWSVSKFFLQSVLVEWEDKLCAYLSTSEIEENKEIFIPQPVSAKSKSTSRKVITVTGSSYEIELTKRMLIENDGKVSIDTENDSDNVLIQNDANRPYSTGISIYNSNDNQYYGNCVFNTNRGNIGVIPVNKAFLMFSSKDVQNNTVILNSENPGMLIDLTTSNDNYREVSYDADKGWESNGEGWGKQYPSGTNLKTLLIL